MVGGRLGWVVIQNNFFENIRTNSDIAVPGGDFFVPFTENFSDNSYTLLVNDMNFTTPGNINSITKQANGFLINTGLPTKINFLAIK